MWFEYMIQSVSEEEQERGGGGRVKHEEGCEEEEVMRLEGLFQRERLRLEK